ncbi:hypothetical protein C8J56DRAFT_879791 [Mycena floridula]|nr:hypothetical protein C8J56DRAFT_879791 [Mycena floridula]
MINLEISRYEPSIAENTRILPSRFTRKRHRNVDDSTENIDGSSGVTHDRQIQLEKDSTASEPLTLPQEQTERQRGLHAQAVRVGRRVADSEVALNSVDVPPPEFTRALMTEIIRLNVEIQALHDLNRLDWARGLTDIPPPSYPHSETSSL